MRICLIFLFSMTGLATTYFPLDLGQQLRESSAVVRAVYQGQSYKKLANRQIVTEATFKVTGSAGLTPHDIINPQGFKVTLPGGEWQGVSYQVDGVPTFQAGEETVLLLSKQSKNFMISNMGLGKYQITRKNNKTFLSSSVFPEHQKLGKISWDSFNDLLIERFGEKLKKPQSDKYVYIKNKKIEASQAKKLERKIASQGSSEKQEDNSLYFLMIFLIIGGAFFLIKGRNI